MINADKPHLWKKDIVKSVDLFNNWFMKFAPKTYRDTRKQTTEQVINAIVLTNNLTNITINSLIEHPEVLPILRMSTSPPLARDRLIGLAHANKNLVMKMEEGKLALQMYENELNKNLNKICKVIHELLDTDIFTWVPIKKRPTKREKERASTIVADRLCGAVANPIIRNAQEQRQLALIKQYLEKNIDEVNINLRKIINNNRLEPEEKLKEAFENHLALLIKYSDNVTIYLNELGNLSKKNQLIYLNKRKKYGEEFQKIVVELKKKGYFEGLNEKIIVLGLLGMLNLVVKWYKKDGPLTINEISNIFYRTIIER